MKNIILTSILFLSISCFSQKQKANLKLPDNFYGCWTSSYEENDQKTEILIYRPCKYKEFGASMFRHYIEFKKDGKCTYLQAAPNDAHFEAPGTWMYPKKGGLITVLNEKKELVFKFKIEHIEKNLMKITTPNSR